MPAVNSGRKVRTVAAAILEAVHLLGDDIGGLADRAGEDLGRFEDRHLDALEAVEPAHTVERVDDGVEAVGRLAPDVLGASDLLRALAHGGGLSIFASHANSEAGCCTSARRSGIRAAHLPESRDAPDQADPSRRFGLRRLRHGRRTRARLPLRCGRDRQHQGGAGADQAPEPAAQRGHRRRSDRARPGAGRSTGSGGRAGRCSECRS